MAENTLNSADDAYCFDIFQVKVRERVLLRGAKEVPLAPKAFDLLVLLIENRNRVVPKPELKQLLWQGTPFVDDNNLNQLVTAIRKALGNRRYIQNRPRVGYRFVAILKNFATPEAEIAPAGIQSAPPGTGEPKQTDRLPSEPSTVAGKPDSPASTQPLGRPAFPQDRETAPPTDAPMPIVPPPTGNTHQAHWWRNVCLWITLAMLILFLIATASAAFGLAVLASFLCAVTAVIASFRAKDTPYTRASAAILLTAVMSFIPTAATLAPLMSTETVVNISALPPAPAYLFVTGLKFIPLLVLVLAFWSMHAPQGITGFQTSPGSRNAYAALAFCSLFLTCYSLAATSGDSRFWLNTSPGRQVLSAYALVLALNLIAGIVAYRVFNGASASSRREVLSQCVIFYFAVAPVAVFIDHQLNQVNRYHLDKRHPEAYVAANPNAVDGFRRHSGNRPNHEVGRDLEQRLDDPNFVQALRTQKFYRQSFDEPFQFLRHAVMYGYKVQPP
ncbi:MAG: winged helix-turn-helix domain-containing protein, partial [Bryobacteraceae bacterium]